MIHIITGPLASGKSTLKRKLCAEYNAQISVEIPFGVDLGNWKEIENYAKRNKTSVVETHFRYKGHDSGETEIGPFKKPFSDFHFHILIPKLDVLFKRQKEVVKEDIKWYQAIAIQIPDKQKTLYKNI
jgi:deoxyadenosine/deoxycytidine kinase